MKNRSLRQLARRAPRNLQLFFNKISLFIKKHPRRFKKILALIGLIVLSVFFVFASIGFIAYYNYADSALVDTLVKVFPYPAATVNGHVITLQEWQNECAIWKAVNDKSQQSTDSRYARRRA